MCSECGDASVNSYQTNTAALVARLQPPAVAACAQHLPAEGRSLLQNGLRNQCGHSPGSSQGQLPLRALAILGSTHPASTYN